MKNKGVKIFLYLIFIGLIAGSAVLLYYSMYTPQPTEELKDVAPEEIKVEEADKSSIKIEADTVKMSPDVDLVQEKRNHGNDDIIARLEIEDLFNVLVVKGENNKFYLDHSIDRNYDYKGSTFADYRTDVDNNQINIYGHNSRDARIEVPFMRLEKFLEKDFFDAHPYIIFQYVGGKRVYKITSIKEVVASQNEHMKVTYTGQSFVNHVNILKSGEGVIFQRDVPFNAKSNIIVLQTCSHHLNNAFYIITGIQINYLEQ